MSFSDGLSLIVRCVSPDTSATHTDSFYALHLLHAAAVEEGIAAQPNSRNGTALSSALSLVSELVTGQHPALRTLLDALVEHRRQTIDGAETEGERPPSQPNAVQPPNETEGERPPSQPNAVQPPNETEGERPPSQPNAVQSPNKRGEETKEREEDDAKKERRLSSAEETNDVLQREMDVSQKTRGGSKPPTPPLHRLPLDLDDPLALRPAERPMSRQFEYRPQPTGEGLYRLLTFASAESAAVVRAGQEEPLLGLMLLHRAVRQLKQRSPYRLVKFPQSPIWHVNGASPAPATGRPPYTIKSLPPQFGGGMASRAPPAQGAFLELPPITAQLRSKRQSTAERIRRRYQELRRDLETLYALHQYRPIQPQQQQQQQSNKSLSATKPQLADRHSTAAAAPAVLPRLPSQGRPAATSRFASSDIRPPTSVVADAVARSLQRANMSASVPTTATVNSVVNPRLPIIPHRGTEAASALGRRGVTSVTLSTRHTLGETFF